MALFQVQTATRNWKAELITPTAERMPVSNILCPGRSDIDRQPVELPRQPDGEVANVDHLLNFAQPSSRIFPDSIAWRWPLKTM